MAVKYLKILTRSRLKPGRERAFLIMISQKALAKKIQSIGFSCTLCGSCCRCSEIDTGLVMVSADEVRALMSLTGLSWDEVAFPYPELIDDGRGGRYTLGWCVRYDRGACRFLVKGRCAVYKARPWICRTYPFMLDSDRLLVSECGGLGQVITGSDALRIAQDLIARKKAEDEEAERMQRVLRENPLPAGSSVVIDSEGVKQNCG